MSEPVNSTISPWMPEQDQIRLAVLGKLIEECNELAGRAARCVIQGVDEKDPSTGRTNLAELEREIADVMACIGTAYKHFPIKTDYARVNAKELGFERWHGMIADLRGGAA